MDEEGFDRFVETREWVFAKSYKGTRFEHEYTVKRGESDVEFERAVEFIREHGIDKKFFGKVYRYYYRKGYKYWTMGAPISETIIINRERVG